MLAGLARPIALTLCIALTAVISACGGGDEAPAASPSPPPAPPPPTAAKLSAGTTQVGVTADISDAAPAPTIVHITVANPGSTNLAYKVTWTGSAVASATFAWESPAAGQLSILVPSPASLTVGKYSGSVQLSACADAACTDNVGGSPLTVAVSYSVIDSSADTATFSVQAEASGFDVHTADANPPTAMFNVYLRNVPAAGVFIQPSQPKAGFVTAATSTQSVDTSGQTTVAISLTLVKPAALGSGFFDSSVTFTVCYDTACRHQLAGSPATEPISYHVYLTEGVEYSLRTVNAAGISDLAYDTVGQKLYVSGLSGLATPFSGAVSQIDPATGAIGTRAALADSLFGIAASDDGSYVYVGSASNPVVHRLTIPSLAPDIDIPLGSSGDPNAGGGANIVSELAVAPGAPHTVAVSLGHPQSLYTGGTVVFDDAVARAQILEPLGYYAEPDAIAWGATATSLYVSRDSPQEPPAEDLTSVTVGGNGLTVASSVAVDPAIYAFGRQFYGAGRAYDVRGHVVEASSGVALGQFAFPVSDPIVTLLPDPSHGRVFVLQPNGEQERLLLLCYDDSTFALQSVVDLGVDNHDVELTTHLISWGADGIAFNRNGVLILSGTFSAPPTSTVATLRAAKSSALESSMRPIHVSAPVIRR